MANCMLAEEVREFLSAFFQEDGMNEVDEWKSLTPIELGILSWHLESFYYDPRWWIEWSGRRGRNV